MLLPKKISPNPLVTTVVEIRFSSDIKQENVLNEFYPLFSKSFSKINHKMLIPSHIKDSNLALRYQADYIFSNENYSISVGKNVILFENVVTYNLWTNYFEIIKENLSILYKSNKILKTERIGLRYVSIFKDTKFEDALNLSSPFIGLNKELVKYTDYKENNRFYRSTLAKDNINLLLQIGEDISVQKPDNSINTGLYIDIDVSIENNLPGINNDGINKTLELIDRLHTEEKNLFYSSLKKEFILTLNPQY